MNRFFSTGDLGDVIASLPAVRTLGGGEYIIGFHDWTGQRESMRGGRFEAIKPLLENQPYISNVEWSDDPTNINYDFSTFRAKYSLHSNLALSQARHIGVGVSLNPWLQIDTEVNNHVVIARSSRYHNPLFPWRRLTEHFKEKIFVGTKNEHAEFQELFGEIEYVPTSNLLELTKLIGGSKLLICNQSCPFWIAAGLGKPIIQETFQRDMNSIIERPNCRYSRNVTEINDLLKSVI